MATVVTDFQDWLAVCKVRPFRTRSSYFCVYESGRVKSRVKDICYSDLTGQIGAKELTVFHPRIEGAEDYVNYVLNSKFFGPCFHTKDAEDGFEYGFVVNTEVPSNYLRFSLIALRGCFEHPRYLTEFHRLKKLGCSEDEAFFFGSLIRYRYSRVLSFTEVGHGIIIKLNHHFPDFVNGKYQQSGRFANKHLTPTYASACLNMDPSQVLKKVIKQFSVPQQDQFGRLIMAVENTDENILKIIETCKKEWGLE